MGSERISLILAGLPRLGTLLSAVLLVALLLVISASPEAAAAAAPPTAEAARPAPPTPTASGQAPAALAPGLTPGTITALLPDPPTADPSWGDGAAATPLSRRLQHWPAWQLPAPLPRPGQRSPVWPAWFRGDWLVLDLTALDADGATPPTEALPHWPARFRDDGHGAAAAERAFNANAAGRALLGDRLLSVQDDPADPRRQLARLRGDALLETTLVGQRGEEPRPGLFLNDELSLQVLHGPGEPRVSRVETLGRWQLRPDGSIDGDQWQARYGSPAEGLRAAPLSTDRLRLRLVPAGPGSDPAIGTGAPATGYR
ncbi:MAG: DUF6816 family protein [Cyanobium sp.]